MRGLIALLWSSKAAGSYLVVEPFVLILRTRSRMKTYKINVSVTYVSFFWFSTNCGDIKTTLFLDESHRAIARRDILANNYFRKSLAFFCPHLLTVAGHRTPPVTQDYFPRWEIVHMLKSTISCARRGLGARCDTLSAEDQRAREKGKWRPDVHCDLPLPSCVRPKRSHPRVWLRLTLSTSASRRAAS